jgi:2-polyprenyl-3-methyl-5-hydroxy-6-metoxy-1,4-benzoquinol methylase
MDSTTLHTVSRERAGGDDSQHRFPFGANWARFARDVDWFQVESAVRSLNEMLGEGALVGKSFLDVGAGSGLFSLSAALLGARRVQSFDYDDESVITTRAMKDRFATAADWTIERGSAIDESYMHGLGTFDIVYAWGVLHHTGDMWRGLELTAGTVAPGGTLFVSIYNDQGNASRRWLTIKRMFNRLPPLLRPIYAILAVAPRELRLLAGSVARRQVRVYLATWRRSNRGRGMSAWHDLLDWVGGYPFEVATPEEIFDFVAARGFRLVRLKTSGGGHGCNEFVFVRDRQDLNAGGRRSGGSTPV